MIYAVATHSFLVVVDLDKNWRVQDYQLLNTGYHYGMAIMEGGRRDIDNQNSTYLVVYRGGESVSKQNDRQLMIYHGKYSFDFVDSIPLVGEMGDVHQIAFANGGFYIANSKYNSLVFQHSESNIRHEYFFEDVAYDLNHINSVYPCGNQILVILHNVGRQESELAILQHDLAKGLTLKRKLSLWHHACHNIFFDDDHLLYNASPVHSLVKVDLTKGRVARRLSFEGHSKGLSVTREFLLVGLSEDTFRDRRSVSRGQLAVIDRHTFSILSIVDLNFPALPHPIGNVNEIRCLSGGELAHARLDRLNSYWSSLELAEKSPLHHRLRRMQMKLLLPLRRMKKYLRQYL